MAIRERRRRRFGCREDEPCGRTLARVDGTEVAADWDHLTSVGGETELTAPIVLTEVGDDISPEPVFTATAPTGDYTEGLINYSTDCDAWTAGGGPITVYRNVLGGHHLADPGQRHDENSRAETRFISVRKRRTATVTRPRFSLSRCRFTPIRTSHPSGSRQVGLLRWGGQTPGPWLTEPQKIVGAPPRSKWCHAGAGGSGCGSLSIRHPDPPAPGRGLTERWLGASAAPSNPRLAR